MDYRQLHLFLAAAERLNPSHAAEAMNMTQPGLAKSLHRLRRGLGTKLSRFSLRRVSCSVGANSRQCAEKGPFGNQCTTIADRRGVPSFPVACGRRHPPDIASGLTRRLPPNG
jgi:hypothetical protein